MEGATTSLHVALYQNWFYLRKSVLLQIDAVVRGLWGSDGLTWTPGETKNFVMVPKYSFAKLFLEV